MVFFCRCNLLCGSTIPNNNNKQGSPGLASRAKTAQTKTPLPALKPISTPGSVPIYPATDFLSTSRSETTPVATYTKSNLQILLKIQMGAKKPSNKEHCKGTLKTLFSNLYTKKSDTDYYHFIQQYKDNFKTSQAIWGNCTLFATTFFSTSISFF